ncbi:MAG: hypothetical protein IPN33_05685 [Saprospiraceae bacterium]|nr:hypothetical protein [Saprospiraceae bacterium]
MVWIVSFHAVSIASAWASGIEKTWPVETMLVSYKNDGAYLLVSQTIDRLKAQDKLDSPLGIRAQMAEGRALEQDQQDEPALQKLLHVKEAAQQQQLWEIFARACLSLANLYEKSASIRPVWPICDKRNPP